MIAVSAGDAVAVCKVETLERPVFTLELGNYQFRSLCNKDSGRRNHPGGYAEVVAWWRVTRASQSYLHKPLTFFVSGSKHRPSNWHVTQEKHAGVHSAYSGKSTL
jgi:hypothetical protein